MNRGLTGLPSTTEQSEIILSLEGPCHGRKRPHCLEELITTDVCRACSAGMDSD